MNSISDFGKTAQGLAKNPLGIIALFIVLIYGFASLVVGFSGKLESGERIPIIWFLVIFPCLVLFVFSWLVSKHHTNLYAPSDYREDGYFIQASKDSYKAAISLGAATAKWISDSNTSDEFEKLSNEVAENIVRVTSPRRKIETTVKKVLWVDDSPNNNLYERQALEAVGIKFVLATSTDDGLNKLKNEKFDAIISDMGRPPDPHAGYTLLSAVRSKDHRIPFIIYAGSKAPEHIAESKSRGAQGTTNRPDELFQMVLEAVGMKSLT